MQEIILCPVDLIYLYLLLTCIIKRQIVSTSWSVKSGDRLVDFVLGAISLESE